MIENGDQCPNCKTFQLPKKKSGMTGRKCQNCDYFESWSIPIEDSEYELFLKGK